LNLQKKPENWRQARLTADKGDCCKLIINAKRLGKLSQLCLSVENISQSIAVIGLGKISEIIKSIHLKDHSFHPYTSSLLAAVPLPDPKHRLIYDRLVKGNPPNPADSPQGCRFHPRCPLAEKK